MNHPIKPPCVLPTQAEHRVAFMKWTLNHLENDVFLPLVMARSGDYNEGGFNERLEERGQEFLADVLERIRPGGWENIWWVDHNGLKGFESFVAYHEEALSEEHCGDCCAVACGCGRCHAEDLYERESTVTWHGKSEGYRLLHEYRALTKPQQQT